MCSNLFTYVFRNSIYPSTIIKSTRSYARARWVNRNPAIVNLPYEDNSNLKKEKVIDLTVDTKNEAQKNIPSRDKKSDVHNSKMPINSIAIKTKREAKMQKKMFYLSQKKVFDDNGEIIYEKLKEKDGRIMPLLGNLKSKKERLRTGNILVEGHRLIIDGLEANCKLKYVIFSQVEDLNQLKPLLPNTGVLFYKMPYKDMEIWSSVETSTGLFGIFEIPTTENIKRKSRPVPLQFICDNIRNPGNLGAILRAAVGVGCDKVFLTKGCVDLWDPKVIRSAAGAHFRQPIYNSMEWEQIESLLTPQTSIFVADNNTEDLDEVNKNISNLPPVLPYYAVDFSNLEDVALIIGGETEGISENSYKMAASRNGLRLNIPLQKGVESLNSAMAAAVIAFEIKKQFIQAWKKLSLQNKEMNIN